MTNLTKLDNVTKVILIVLVIAVSYFVIFLIIKPFFVSQPTSMSEMMNRVIRGDTSSTLINLFSLIIALIIGVIISFYLFKQNKTREEDKFNIIRKVLSDDEKKVLDEVKKAGEITQDSLRFRLNWSKAKISTILTNLDKKGLVQRERSGKTYRIYLQKV